MNIYEITEQNVSNTYKTIGMNVKKIREKNNISQLELSYKMGYKSVSLVSAAELCSSDKHFNIEHLYKMAVIFNVEICEFFQDIHTKSNI
ncbi:MAG: helix-turn-helix transcriptional regulator [Sulfurimonas sp.]